MPRWPCKYPETTCDLEPGTSFNPNWYPERVLFMQSNLGRIVLRFVDISPGAETYPPFSAPSPQCEAPTFTLGNQARSVAFAW